MMPVLKVALASDVSIVQPMSNDLTDRQLFDLILKYEDEMDDEGIDPKGRSFELPDRIMKELGYISYIAGGPGTPPIYGRIRAIHKVLYRDEDVGVGGLHGGAFMFRGIVASFYVPIIFGQVSINPLDLCDLTDYQKLLLARRPSDVDAYCDTFGDAFDFAGAVMRLAGYDEPPAESRPLLGLAAFHLQAAAATLRTAFDERGSVQSSILASELVLKAALRGKGASEADLRRLGHSLTSLIDAVGEAWPSFDVNAVRDRSTILPPYVANRYSEAQPSRREAGEIVMTAQFVAGSVARAMTGGSFSSSLVQEPSS
jgi:HEPN domain-containing protein